MDGCREGRDPYLNEELQLAEVHFSHALRRFKAAHPNRRVRPGSSEVCSPVSASKEIHSFSGIVRKTVETRVSINAAMIPTQKSAFAIFAFE